MKYVQRKNIYNSVYDLEEKLAETFFDMQEQVKTAVYTSDKEEFNRIIRKIAGAPNSESVREIKQKYSTIPMLIKDLESDAIVKKVRAIDDELTTKVKLLLNSIFKQTEEEAKIPDLSKYKWRSKHIDCIYTFEDDFKSPVTCFEEIKKDVIEEGENDQKVVKKVVKKVHLLAAGFGNPDTSIALYDLKSYQLERKWKAHEKTVTDLLFFKNKLISASCDGKLIYWHIDFLNPDQHPKRVQTVQAHKAYIFKLI